MSIRGGYSRPIVLMHCYQVHGIDSALVARRSRFNEQAVKLFTEKRIKKVRTNVSWREHHDS
jgi:hypothetical protein